MFDVPGSHGSPFFPLCLFLSFLLLFPLSPSLFPIPLVCHSLCQRPRTVTITLTKSGLKNVCHDDKVKIMSLIGEWKGRQGGGKRNRERAEWIFSLSLSPSSFLSSAILPLWKTRAKSLGVFGRCFNLIGTPPSFSRQKKLSVAIFPSHNFPHFSQLIQDFQTLIAIYYDLFSHLTFQESHPFWN